MLPVAIHVHMIMMSNYTDQPHVSNQEITLHALASVL